MSATLDEVQVQPAATLCLAQAVQQLIDEAGPKAGQADALLAWAVLSRIKANALAFGVPLTDIGLDGFDPDRLLKKPATQAA